MLRHTCSFCPSRTLPPSWSLQPPFFLCSLSTGVLFSSGTTLVTLSVRQPILCHFQSSGERRQFGRAQEVNKQLGTAEGSLTWPACHTPNTGHHRESRGCLLVHSGDEPTRQPLPSVSSMPPAPCYTPTSAPEGHCKVSAVV